MSLKRSWFDWLTVPAIRFWPDARAPVSAMTTQRTRAHDFFETHVEPTVGEWMNAPTDIRRAMNAAVALNQMADHFWHGFVPLDPAGVLNTSSPGAFRAELAKRNEDFALLRDVAEAHKHVRLDRPARAVTSAGQSFIGATGFGEGRFGEGPFCGGPSVVVALDSEEKRHLSAVAEAVMKLCSSMLA